MLARNSPTGLFWNSTNLSKLGMFSPSWSGLAKHLEGDGAGTPSEFAAGVSLTSPTRPFKAVCSSAFSAMESSNCLIWVGWEAMYLFFTRSGILSCWMFLPASPNKKSEWEGHDFQVAVGHLCLQDKTFHNDVGKDLAGLSIDSQQIQCWQRFLETGSRTPSRPCIAAGIPPAIQNLATQDWLVLLEQLKVWILGQVETDVMPIKFRMSVATWSFELGQLHLPHCGGPLVES